MVEKTTKMVKEAMVMIDENEKNITYREENEKLKEKIEELKAEVNQWRYEKAEREEREHKNKCEVVDSSYTLKLGEIPKLIYVSQHGKGSSDILYVDGKIVQGVVSFNLFSSIDKVTRHTVEYNTCQAK